MGFSVGVLLGVIFFTVRVGLLTVTSSSLVFVFSAIGLLGSFWVGVTFAFVSGAASPGAKGAILPKPVSLFPKFTSIPSPITGSGITGLL